MSIYLPLIRSEVVAQRYLPFCPTVDFRAVLDKISGKGSLVLKNFSSEAFGITRSRLTQLEDWRELNFIDTVCSYSRPGTI